MKFIKIPVKGMNDFMPSDMRLREYVLSMIKETYSSYGFMQIATPVMEHIENLTSKQGGDNENLIFKIMKRGADLARAIEKNSDELADYGLRYDLTVPLARYYANNKENLPIPFKAMQMDNVWRADKPQKGRFRQFTQCDIDILGDDSNLAEIELISATTNMISKIFNKINIKNFTVHINDRQILKAAALSAGFSEDDIGSVLISLDKYDKIGLDGIKSELIKNGYSDDVVDKYLEIYQNLSDGISAGDFCKDFVGEFLSDTVIDNMEEIVSCVKSIVNDDVTIMFDPTLVRGMGYYTGTIFEIGIDGYNFSIAGGGRYDKMIGKFSGQEVCACGFSIGFERIITIFKDYSEKGIKISENSVAFLIEKNLPLEKKLEVFERAKKLREDGAIVTIQPMRKNMTVQIDRLMAEGYTKFEKIYNK